MATSVHMEQSVLSLIKAVMVVFVQQVSIALRPQVIPLLVLQDHSAILLAYQLLTNVSHVLQEIIVTLQGLLKQQMLVTVATIVQRAPLHQRKFLVQPAIFVKTDHHLQLRVHLACISPPH